MIDQATLTIDIHGYWHNGTGRGSGSHLDAIVDTGHDGLPYLSGRHIKGLLRDAVYKAERWRQLDGFLTEATDPAITITDVLFGKRNEPESRIPRDETTVGTLRIANAQLPREIRQWLAQEHEHRRYASHLHRDLSSTAIDGLTGVARSRSLRGIQVNVPLTLSASIEAALPPQVGPTGPDEVAHQRERDRIAQQWQEVLDRCLPLIRAVGAQRGRGLGRASLSLSWEGRS
ncbi:MAG: RAMP superfamily CRISPR-associated protein [Gammaproteobacteria bacterium]